MGMALDNTSVVYKRKMGYERLNDPHHPADRIFKWNNWVPKKVNTFIWRANRNGISTRDSLSRKGVQIPNQTTTFVFSSEYLMKIQEVHSSRVTKKESYTSIVYTTFWSI